MSILPYGMTYKGWVICALYSNVKIPIFILFDNGDDNLVLELSVHQMLTVLALVLVQLIV